MVLDSATYAEKQFLSNVVENPASSTASVCTATEDGMLLLDAAITLVNQRGEGATFGYHFGYDTVEQSGNLCFNDHDSPGELALEIKALMRAVNDWGLATVAALAELTEAANAAEEAIHGGAKQRP